MFQSRKLACIIYFCIKKNEFGSISFSVVPVWGIDVSVPANLGYICQWIGIQLCNQDWLVVTNSGCKIFDCEYIQWNIPCDT